MRILKSAVIGMVFLGTNPVFPQITEGPDTGSRIWIGNSDPTVVHASFASTIYSNCSATMIGPTTLLTAGHCDQFPTVNFNTDVGFNNLGNEQFQVTQIQHTWIDSDLVLKYVAPNCTGSAPVSCTYAGIKYGYLDFDLIYAPDGQVDYERSRNLLASGTDVFSIWQNSVAGFSGTRPLVSGGKILSSNDSSAWYVPSDWPATGRSHCTQNLSLQFPLGVKSDLFGIQGASGSSSLNPRNGRILLGPLSLTPDGAGGRPREQLGIVDYLKFGFSDPNVVSNCNPTWLPSVALNALPPLTGLSDNSIFHGGLDKNNDGVFDLQHAIEAFQGEASRDVYDLDLASRRKVALFNFSGPATFLIDYNSGVVSLDTRESPRAGISFMELDHLNIVTGQGYYLIFRAQHQLFQREPGFIRIKWGPDNRANLGGQRLLALRVQGLPALRGGDEYQVIEIRSDNPRPQITFNASKGMKLRVSDMVLMRDDAELDFDTHDQRNLWTTQDGSGRALIWPRGKNPPGDATPNWAGVVTRNPYLDLADVIALKTNFIVKAANERARVCFSHRQSRQNQFSSWPMYGTAVLRSKLTNQVVARSAFLPAVSVPNARWTESCTPWVTTPELTLSLEFGTFLPNGGLARGRYLVDDVRIERSF